MKRKIISVLLLFCIICNISSMVAFAENADYVEKMQKAVFCSSWQDGAECTQAIDGDLNTKWAAEGDGEWLEFALEKGSVIDKIGLAFSKGDKRTYPFELLASDDGVEFTQIYSGQNSMTTDGVELYSFEPVAASYLRVVMHGNSSNKWNNIIEVTELPLRSDKIGINYNGKHRFFDVEPVMQNDRVLIPLRGFFEMTGYQVDWEKETQGITVSTEDKVIQLQIDSLEAMVNGKKQILDQAPILLKDTAMIPVRFVSETLGLIVDWDNEKEDVILHTDEYQNKYGLAEADEFYSEKLDGKKIIFIGNSMVYYGRAVLTKDVSMLKQEDRDEDKGYFYQLCRLHGVDVSVTNWTFGNHSFGDLFGGNCAANRGCDGVDHASYLTDRNYDYVVFSEKSVEGPNFIEDCEYIMDFFRKENPQTQFVYLCHHRSHILNRTGVLNNLKTLADKGVTIVDWGKVVYDIMNGTVSVPNATQTYDNNSFIIRQSETDGSHENMLSGYITALATYCAITGTSAQGQPYWFCNDKSIETSFDFDIYKETYYSYDNATTNFDEIFASPADMDGIQQVIDKTLQEKAWQYYGE